MAEVISTEANPQAQRSVLQLLRILLGAIAIWCIAQTIALSTDFILLALSFGTGVLLAGLLLPTRTSLWGLLAAHAGLAVLVAILLHTGNLITLETSQAAVSDFIIPLLGQHIWLCFALYLFGLLSTWAFWTKEHALTFESLSAVAIVIWLLSAHRNYRLDAPKEVASLSWKLELFQHWGVEPQHIILGIGVLSTLVFMWYVGIASFRPLYTKERVIQTRARPAYLQVFFSGLCALAVLVSLTWFVNDWYTSNIARASNGVGPSAELENGESNLGFNSAVTATRQPAAILRLDADYKQNPNAPMLYLREGALSKFASRELVKAESRYDTDIPQAALGQIYTAANKPQGEQFRTPIPQSIYIISRHQSPFSIDGTTRLRPLKNPNPNRFQHAYQALSLAPTRPLQSLVHSEIGSPDWDEATWEHYTRAPGSLSKEERKHIAPDTSPGADSHGEDLRYRQLAEQLASGESNKLIQAAKIVRYLSEESIYTRSPGHDVASDGDPVAPYLFGEKKRGYCVHFAHAAVYMFRLLGIPARIGTGYQTDTKYAKDGHILLMLGDRHAWPEIYINGRGWTVFDIAPAQAENEPELVPDSNLLEELMSELDPAPEFLESQATKVPSKALSLDRKVALILATTAVLGFFLLIFGRKLYLYYGCYATKKPQLRARRAYIALAARLADLGQSRRAGETRLEFLKRLANQEGQQLVTCLEESVYPKVPRAHSKEHVLGSLAAARLQAYKPHPWYKRLLAAFSLSSVLKARSL